MEKYFLFYDRELEGIEFIVKIGVGLVFVGFGEYISILVYL